jgi:hypothetical protein
MRFLVLNSNPKVFEYLEDDRLSPLCSFCAYIGYSWYFSSLLFIFLNDVQLHSCDKVAYCPEVIIPFPNICRLLVDDRTNYLPSYGEVLRLIACMQ